MKERAINESLIFVMIYYFSIYVNIKFIY